MSKDEFQIWNAYKDIALLKKEQLERECYGFWKWIWLKVGKVEKCSIAFKNQEIRSY